MVHARVTNPYFRLCHDWGAHEVDRAIACAAEEGHESTVRPCRDLGATDVDGAMVSAACSDHESVVRECHDWGAEELDTTMAHAAGHIRIVILCHSWGATVERDYNQIVQLWHIWAVIDSDRGE